MQRIEDTQSDSGPSESESRGKPDLDVNAAMLHHHPTRRKATVQVQIRLTPEERAQLVRIAAQRDQTLSAVVRHWMKRYRTESISGR